jgi:hypothetical protein
VLQSPLHRTGIVKVTDQTFALQSCPSNAAGTASKLWRNIQLGMRQRASRLVLAASVLCLSAQSEAFTGIHCDEKWFDHARRGSDDHDYRSSNCKQPSSTFKPLGDWYWLADGKVYFRSVRTEKSSDCGGRGVGAMGNLLNPRCYLPSSLQSHDHYETRSFWLTSRDGVGFRLASTRHPLPHSPRMAMVLQRYGVDGKTAYLNGNELVGADAETFEVIFPFEEDAQLNDLYVAIDRDHLFINRWTLPRVDLSRIEWLVVPCSADMSKWRLESCKRSSIRSLGRVGSDLLYMSHSHRPALLSGLAPPDLRCEEVVTGKQCHIGGRIYEIRGSSLEPPAVEAMTEEQARLHRHR